MLDYLTSQIAAGLRAKRIRLSLLIVIGLATSCTSPKPPKQEDEKVSVIPVKRLVFAPPPEGLKHKPRVTIRPVEGVDQLRNLSMGATTEELTSVVFALDRFRVVESMPAAPVSENADYLILCKLTELAYEQRKGNTYVDGSKLASKGLRSALPWLGGSDIDNVMWTQDDLDVRVTCRVVANLLLPNGEVLARETGLVQRQDKVKAIKAEVLGVVIDR
ncbi:MAG: hypothetical protein HS113_01675 [Verrucomicrobiales bacterium]|nr:hypothetical protein [Verrucomicrobiales bacterium]